MDKRGFDSTTVKILTRAANTICIIVMIFCFLIIIMPRSSVGFEDLVIHSSVFESLWIIIPMIFISLVILVTLFALFRNYKIRKILKAQQDKNILNMPLEHYGADTSAKAENPIQNCSNVSGGSGEFNIEKNTAAAQEAHIRRLMDDNAAEIAKYTGLARRALLAGKEDEAWIFVDKKQSLEVSRVAINAAYANIVNILRARVFTPKDDAEALAEKYAAQDRMACAEKGKKAARTKFSVDDEIAKMKSDMGL